MADTSVDFFGVRMRSPFGIAALAKSSIGEIKARKHAEMLMESVKAGGGHVTTHYICPELMKDYPKGKEPLIKWGMLTDESPAGDLKYLFLSADEHTIMGRKDSGMEMLKYLKDMVPPDVPIVANIIGPGSDAQAWADHAREFEDAGADIIELDPSCAITAFHLETEWAVAPQEEGFPVNVAADEIDVMVDILKAVTRKVKIPVGFKMSPETGWPRMIYLAKATYDAGAKFISCTNAPYTFSPIDIYNNGRPLHSAFLYAPHNMWVAAIGSGRAIGRKCTAAIKTFVPQMHVNGITGIMKPEHVIEYIMLGATFCQISSGLMWYGMDIFRRCQKFLEKFMDDQGYETIDDMRGAALKHTAKTAEEFNYRYGELVAIADHSKCTGCGRCMNTICFANYKKGNKAYVDEESCAGCGLCCYICPAGARTLIERDVPKKLDLAAAYEKLKGE